MEPTRTSIGATIALLLLAGCAQHVQPEERITQHASELLSDLQATDPGPFHAAFVAPDVDFSAYSKVLVDQAVIHYQRTRGNYSLPSDLHERVSRAIEASVRKTFEHAGFEAVAEEGPGVLLVRPALLELRMRVPLRSSSGVGTRVVRSAWDTVLVFQLSDTVDNAYLYWASRRRRAPSGAQRIDSASFLREMRDLATRETHNLLGQIARHS